MTALRSLLATFVIVFAALLGAACGGRPDASAGRLVAVDDAGDTVRLARPATRVISLIPATTEILFAIGAGPVVVGRTDYCDYPAAAAAVPSLGDAINPSLEAIVARTPDLVLLYRSAANAAVARRLRELGVPVLELRPDHLADVPRLAALLGTMTAHTREADSVSAGFERDLAAATVQPAGRRPTVFMLVWDQPPMTVGRSSSLTEIMERAGARNIFDDIVPTAAPVSIEAVAARDPDLILSAGDAPPKFAGRPEWQAVPAVRAGRFVRVGGSEFEHPSPRSPAAIRTLAERLAEATR